MARSKRGSKPPGVEQETKVVDYSGDAADTGPGPRTWWDRTVAVEDDDVARAMVSAARDIEKSPSEQLRNDLNILYASLYEGRELTNLYQYGGQAVSTGGAPGTVGMITWNVIRSVVQTVASQVSRSRPRARFVTSGGDYRQKRRAKKLTTFCDGLFSEARVYEKTQQAFVCAGSFDVAGIHVYRENDRVAVDLVRACEIMVDVNDGIDGKPRSMYRRKFVDKGVLMARFGKGEDELSKARAGAIRQAKVADPVGDGGRTNLVEVYEAWHLKSAEDAEDGWYVMAIEASSGGGGGALKVEEFKKSRFPIILFSLDPALSGPYGVSAAATLLPIQVAVNTGLDKIAKGQHLACRPGVWLPLASRVKKGDISSKIGQTNYYAGTTPPTFYTPQAFSAEVYQQLERHYEKGFALYGVNAQVAAGTKEAGTNSAVAIRESLDIQTARFAVLAQRWETLHLDIAKIAIDTARDIYLDNEEMKVSAPGTALLQSIDWADVDLKEDEFVIQVYPTSLLPTTPQGRIDRVNELVTAGIWSPKRGEAALDDLDIDAAVSGQRAAEKNVERMCEAILVDGEYEGPDPTNDLQACLRIGSQYLDEGRINGAPEKHIDLLYRFLDDTVALINSMKAPAAPAAGAPAAPGLPAAPGAPTDPTAALPPDPNAALPGGAPPAPAGAIGAPAEMPAAAPPVA